MALELGGQRDVEVGRITAGPANGATTGASASFTFGSPDRTATFECKLDAAEFTTCTSPRGFTLAGGAHTFAVRAKDPAGLVDPSPATRTWTVDTTPLIDTGNCTLPLTAPALATVAFVPTGLGAGVQFTSPPQGFSYSSGFTSCASQAPGHSLSGWFMSRTTSDGTDTLFDSLDFCGTQGNLCGLDVEIADSELTLFVGDDTPNLPAISIQISNGFHSFVITEQKVPGTTITQSLSIYVDGNLTVMPLGGGNVFRAPRDFVNLGDRVGMILDEIEFWPRDLSADPEMLCENGLDGHWDPVSTSCLFD